MPKRLCTCGETLMLHNIPCEIEYPFISDVEYDRYSGMIDSEELYLEMNSFLRCPTCGRLYVFWKGYGHPPEEFVPMKLAMVDDARNIRPLWKKHLVTWLLRLGGKVRSVVH